ncbi:MAG: PD-(D/E)XK nuclease family protein [Campylobacterota bacterium]|nr:PD-(D/E)XK nuclease family protein [Campylobacterota bacterium]
MEKNNYHNFFKTIKEFKAQQAKQKMRGLNDYNMVNVVRKENLEVGMHSNVIYSLINPEGVHYQGDLFLKLFIKTVLKISDFGEIFEVQAEEQTDNNRRIDFTIKSDKYFIGIEMKVDSGDLKKQIYDYYNYLKKESDKNNKQKVLIYYLTKYSKKPWDGSICDKDKDGNYIDCVKDVRNITFDKDILNWIDASQKEVKNITNLNEALENYKSIVQKITNKYESRVLNMKDFLKQENNIEFLDEIFEMKNSVHKILGTTLHELFRNLENYITTTHGLELVNSMLVNKKEHIQNESRCSNWFYNNEKNLKGLQKVESVGNFFKLSDSILLKLEVATLHFHIGLVSYELDDENYKIIDLSDELKGLIKDNDIELFQRDWRWIKWCSIDCGDFISLSDENVACYKNQENCHLKNEIDKLINFTRGI